MSKITLTGPTDAVLLAAKILCDVTEEFGLVSAAQTESKTAIELYKSQTPHSAGSGVELDVATLKHVEDVLCRNAKLTITTHSNGDTRFRLSLNPRCNEEYSRIAIDKVYSHKQLRSMRLNASSAVANDIIEKVESALVEIEEV